MLTKLPSHTFTYCFIVWLPLTIRFTRDSICTLNIISTRAPN